MSNGLPSPSADSLPAPISWPMTSTIHQVAMKSMDHRAQVEVAEVQNGLDIADVHGEVAKTYPFLESLLMGAAWFSRRIGKPIHGVGADLGSGTGGGACIASRMKAIQKVYAVECSQVFVNEVMPAVFTRFQGKLAKIQRVIGDFNALHLPDGELDFLIEIASFHHSENLELTAAECCRVLNPGGAILAVERAWPDETTPQELEAKLDKPFSPALKKKYGIPEDQHFTRRDWGEHEYTVRQWEDVFQKQGFETIALIQDHPRIRGSNFILTKLPAFNMSLLWAAHRYRGGSARFGVYGWQKQEVVFVFFKK